MINFEQKIDPDINAQVLGLKAAIEQANIPGIRFIIPAYCSLTIGYEPGVLRYEALVKKIQGLEAKELFKKRLFQSRQLKIPVCYETPYALDFKELSKETGLSKTKIIRLHTSATFKVYMLGFLPGFVFMGKLPDALQCRRKTNPRLKVPAGSVGLAGQQTGIYPAETPGGWQIIGRTPLKLFDPIGEDPFLFRAGDTVQFYSISTNIFLEIAAQIANNTFKMDLLYD